MNKQENQQWIEGNIKMPSGSGAVVPLAKVLGYVQTSLLPSLPIFFVSTTLGVALLWIELNWSELTWFGKEINS